MRNILVIELGFTGHRVSSFLPIVVNSLKRKYKVHLLISDEVHNSTQFHEVRKHFKDSNLLVTNINKNSFYKKNRIGRNLVHFRNLFNIKNYLIDNKFHFVYLNTLDDFIIALYIFTFFTNIKLCGLYVQPRLYSEDKSVIKRILINLKKNIVISIIEKVNSHSKILTIDQLSFNYISKRLSKNNLKKFLYIQDFSRVSDDLINNKSVSQQYKRILVYGSLSERKGIITLLESIKSSNDLSFEVVLAGIPTNPIRKYVREYMENYDVNIKCYFEYIDFKLESYLFATSDIVWLGYTKEFNSSSGVLLQAIAYKIPIISTDHGIVGQIVKTHRIGFCFNVNLPDQVPILIKKLIEDSHAYSILRKNCNNVSELYSAKMFSDTISHIYN